MAPHPNYKFNTELFLVPYADCLILYAPLKGLVARINESGAALLRDLQNGNTNPLTPAACQFLDHLKSNGFLNGNRGLDLTIQENTEFAPLCVSLYLTDACNLRCLYCYARGGDNPKPMTIPTAAAHAGIDFVAENAKRTNAKGFAVSFHGAGEPTVAWETLTGLVSYARRRADENGVSVAFTTCTNGVMSEQHARWLAQNTHAASVSLDGLPSHHDRFRPKLNGQGSFDDVARTLRVFDELDLFYSIRATIAQENVGSMGEMVNLMADKFNAAELQFDPLLYTGRCHATGCLPAADATYAAEFMKACDVAETRGCRIGFSILSPNALRTFYCCAVSDGFTVTHEGYVTACFEACAPDRPFADVFLYGRYDPAGNRFVLDHGKIESLRKRHVHNLTQCRNCFCKYMCCGDCPINGLRLGIPLDQGGGRCAVTQSIAKHMMAKMVMPTGHKLPCTVEGVTHDYSLGAWKGHRTIDEPTVYHCRTLNVHECNYMKPPPPDQAARQLISRGNAEYHKCNFVKALGRYDAAIRADAKSPEAYNNRGLALHKLGRLPESIAAFRAAIRLAQTVAAYHLNLGKVLMAAGAPHDALQAFEEALQLDPAMTKAAYNKTWALMELKAFDETASALAALRAMENPPPQTRLLDAILRISEKCGGSENRNDASREAVAENDQWIWSLNQSLATGGLEDIPPEGRDAFANAMRAYSTEQYDRVLQQIDQVLTTTPLSPLPFWLRAMTRQAQGAKKEADDDMAHAVALMPHVLLKTEADLLEVKVDGHAKAPQTRDFRLLPGMHNIQVVGGNGDGHWQCNRLLNLISGATHVVELHHNEITPDAILTVADVQEDGRRTR